MPQLVFSRRIRGSSCRMVPSLFMSLLLVALTNGDTGTLKGTFSGVTLHPQGTHEQIIGDRNYFMTCGTQRINGDDVDGLDIYFTGPDGKRLQTSREAGIRAEYWPFYPKADLYLVVDETFKSGYYTCVVTAGGQTLEAEKYLLFEEPLAVSAPVFQEAELGATVLLQCNGTITEEYNPGITWLKDDTDLRGIQEVQWLANNNEWIQPVDPRYEVTYAGLKINGVKAEDEGTTCAAGIVLLMAITLL